MFQRVRRKRSPTTNNVTSCSATSGAGAGGLTIDPRVGSVSRLLPMKAVVPFHLNPESHPSLITKSLRGASGSPTRSSNINNSEGDAKCTRASTSRACSPARAIPDAPIHSALSISTIGSLAFAVATQTVTSSSSSSSPSPRGSTRGRLQYLPEHDRQSPGRRSLISPICKERAKQPPAAPAPACPVGSGLRRTSSLDTLTGSYLAGHWPRDDSSIQCAPCMRDKATQVNPGHVHTNHTPSLPMPFTGYAPHWLCPPTAMPLRGCAESHARTSTGSYRLP
nr:protein FAM117B-like [Paramormyrops kingsleyae]